MTNFRTLLRVTLRLRVLEPAATTSIASIGLILPAVAKPTQEKYQTKRRRNQEAHRKKTGEKVPFHLAQARPSGIGSPPPEWLSFRAVKWLSFRAVELTGVDQAQRHSFCSHLAMRGHSVLEIQKWAGHATIDVTQRYMHLSPAFERQAAAALDSLDAPDAAGCSRPKSPTSGRGPQRYRVTRVTAFSMRSSRVVMDSSPFVASLRILLIMV